METIQAIGLALMITGAILGIAGNLPPLYDIIRDAVTSWLSSKNSSMGSVNCIFEKSFLSLWLGCKWSR